MVNVRVIVDSIAGLGVSAGVDKEGTIWVVLGAEVDRPYHAYADLMEDLIGRLPDQLTFEVASPRAEQSPIPNPRTEQSLRLVS